MRPYLKRDSARHCECEPVLADSLLFGRRQIRGSKIESCISGIIHLTKRRIIAPLAKTRFNVKHFLFQRLSFSPSVCPSCLSSPFLSSFFHRLPLFSLFYLLPFYLPLPSLAHLSAPITPIPSYVLSLYPLIFSFNISLPPLSPFFYSC